MPRYVPTSADVAAPDGGPSHAAPRLALRIIRLTRISDAGLNLLVCAAAIFLLVPMVAEVFLEIDLDEAALTIAFGGFMVLFCGGAIAGIAAWFMARRRFASAEWTAAVREAQANAERSGDLRSGDTMAAVGGATALTGHIVSSSAPDNSPAEGVGDAAALAGGTTALFGLKKWNRAARAMACEVAAGAGTDLGAYWRGAGQAGWLVPAASYLLALVLAIGGIALGNASVNARAAAVLDEAVAALEAADGVDYAYCSGDAGVSTSDDYHVTAHLVESDSYLRIETDETGAITELRFHFEGKDGWASAEEALAAAETELTLMVAAVEGTALADPLELISAAAFSETFPELVATFDLGADYSHDSQFTDTEDGIEIYESASVSGGELELYLTLSAT